MSSLDAFSATFDVEPGYLDWAAFGPLSSSVRDEVSADLELLSTGRPSSIGLVRDRVHEARTVLAELLGARTDEVTLQPSTAYGLAQAIYGLRGGVIASRAEFPSITVPLTRAASFRDLTAQWIEPEGGRVTPESVAERIDEDTVAVIVSLVDFRTGYRADLAALREIIGPDRLLIVDAVQGFGIVDEDYSAADVVCGHGYKWLRAGRGTGFAWFSPRARERIEPVLSGHAGVQGGMTVDSVPPPAQGATAFTVAQPDPLAAGRLAVAARDVRDAGVGAIEAALRERTDTLLGLADEHDIPVVTPRDPERRAGIVALAPRAQDAAALAAVLTNHGVTATTREGLLRLAPHVATGDDTFRLIADAFAAFTASRNW